MGDCFWIVSGDGNKDLALNAPLCVWGGLKSSDYVWRSKECRQLE